jgi:hypothetical protein
MNNNDLPTEWTDKQRAAYEALKASMERNRRIVSFGKAPKDGWKESDRIAK